MHRRVNIYQKAQQFFSGSLSLAAKIIASYLSGSSVCRGKTVNEDVRWSATISSHSTGSTREIYSSSR